MKKMLFKQKFLFILLGCLIPFGLLAQEVSISGTVVDAEDGMVLPGVTVVVEGTQTGTITDVDGRYSFTAEVGDVLNFSFVGFDSERITVESGVSVYDVELSSAIVGLDEVVAIGYGVQRRSDRTGAVSQVRAEDLNRGSLTDPIQSLQGKASGVMITRQGGDPNAGFSVNIRGASGFESNTQPLYVIDGVPGVDPTTVSPEDIESFDVLKDAASTAIYGSRGSNGVILITTKSGDAGEGTVNFSANFTVDQVANTLDVLSADEYRSFVENNNLTDSFVDNGADVDWQDELFRTGFSQNYNVNFSGGDESSNYYASLTHNDWEGTIKGTNKERTNALLNFSHSAINDRLTLSGSASGTFEQNEYVSYSGHGKQDVIIQTLQRNPTDPVRNEDGSYFHNNRGHDYENPLAVIDAISDNRDAKRFRGNFKAEFEFFEGFTGTVNAGYTRNDHQSNFFRPNELYVATERGYAEKSYSNTTEKMIESYFNYNTTIAQDHNLDLVGGYSWHEAIYDGFNAGGSNPSSDFIKYNNFGTLLDVTRDGIGSYKGMWQLVGFFGRAQYNYQNKYYLTGSIRRDGSTKFGSDNEWGVFPTVSTAWAISEEDFAQDYYWLSNLRVRASYGISGNQEIGEYNAQLYYQPGSRVTDPGTGDDVISYSAAKVANPELQWEQTSELNFGVDFGFVNNRISGSIEYYIKETTDLLGEYSVPMPPNPAPRIWANSGELENRGIEMNLQVYAVDMPNFDWRTSLTFSRNTQEITSLGEYAPATGVRQEGWVSGRGLVGGSNWTTGIIVGESTGSFYLPQYAGLDESGSFMYYTADGGVTDEISHAQRKVAGTALPDAEFGWSNHFTFFQNWSLDMSMRALVGNDVFNATQMLFDYSGNLPNRNVLPEAVEWYEAGRVSGPAVSDLYVEDASFLRLDYVSLGYRLNTDNIDWLRNMQFSLSGNNLFTLTNYTGLDPETTIDGMAYGIDQYNTYPKSRSISFGVSATF
ncbi:SusC/RagA family TonB-linked outer membrane protein [Marinilabiliaceae bacterium ANBcel2]|nr:SusC/RagA family TonB-linked outer membrane protein [Marinilabiliaceae bacterium ANBcel2]